MDIDTITKLTQEFIELGLQIKELELLKASVASQIEEQFKKNDLRSFDTNQHRVTRCFRRRYHYPSEIQALENNLRDTKKRFEIESEDYELTTYISAKLLK
jgi:hypothetical protein